jgi:hypothetical protein
MASTRNNDKSFSRTRLNSAGFRNGVLASGTKQKSALNMSTSSLGFHSKQPPVLPGEITRRSINSACKFSNHIENNVKAMKITDYYEQ